MLPNFDMSGPIAAILAATQQAQQAGQPDWQTWARTVAEWTQAAEQRLQALEKKVSDIQERIDLEIP